MSIRIALAGLLVAGATAIFPGVAAATIAPSLSLNQGAGTAAGSSPATEFDIDITPLSGVVGQALSEVNGDSVRNLTVAFPKGLLINLDMAGGACVVASTPSPACQIGSGVINGPGGKALNMYLVAPPKPSDVAGVETTIEGGSTVIGDLALGTSPEVGFDLSYSNLSPGITEIQFTLSGPRLPTSCSPTENVTVGVSSWQGSSGVASAPLTVTGCNSLPYAPAAAVTVTKESPQSTNAVVVTTFTQGPGQSASSAIEFGIPTGLKVNKVLQPCFTEKPCTVGTVAAESPLLPSPALAHGTLTLGDSISSTGSGEVTQLSAPVAGVTLTMSFPPPYAFSVSAPVSFTEHTISFVGMPDIPLSSLSLTFTGPPGGPAFATSCEKGTIATTFTPQDGNPVSKVTGPVTNVGCPAPAPAVAKTAGSPTASGSLTELASGRPKLQLRATHGANAPNIASMSIALPAGVDFKGAALVKHRVCNGASCQTSVSVKGLSLSGANVRSAHIQGGKLVISFKRAAASVSLTARGPLLTESRALRFKARQQTASALVARLRITDASGSSTVVSVV